MIKLLFIVILLSIQGQALANELKIGEFLPPVIVSGNGGELVVNDNKVEYKPWDSSKLKGKVRLIYHVAARVGVDKINQHFLDALVDAGGLDAFPTDKFRVVSILNSGDVFPMGGMFARKIFEMNRLEHSHPEFVLDAESRVQHTWNLSRKSSAVIIIDKMGRVLKFKDGKLSNSEIEDFISTIEQHI
jgi:YtfJ family uncharacterized protein